MALHGLDADGSHIPDFHAQHFAAFFDDLTVTFGGEFLVL
jgi:hypothetical protein